MDEFKKDVAKWMRRLYAKGLTTSLGGNISLRLKDGSVAITASEVDKGDITPEQIAIVDEHGVCVDTSLKISMETRMHLAIYQTRPDVNAIVHAHAVYASTFAAMEQGINTHLLAEAYNIVGDPSKAGYALPGSERLANMVAGAVMKSNVVLMENHGVLAVGSSLLQAFDRIEVLENAAKMTIVTRLLKDSKGLDEKDLKWLK